MTRRRPPLRTIEDGELWHAIAGLRVVCAVLAVGLILLAVSQVLELSR